MPALIHSWAVVHASALPVLMVTDIDRHSPASISG